MLELLILLGLSGATYYDYTKGFALARSLGGRAEKIYLRLSGKKPLGPAERARAAVMLQEAKVEKLRKSVASIAARSQAECEGSQEQILLAQRFQKLKEEAVGQSDDESAQVAALAELEALRRSDIQRQFSEYLGKMAKKLETRLDRQERELLLMKDKQSTIELRSQVSDGLNTFYQLLSDVDAVTGEEAPRVLLERELKNSRLEELTAGNLIGLAEKKEKLQGKMLPEASLGSMGEVQQEINILQKRIALPEHTGEALN